MKEVVDLWKCTLKCKKIVNKGKKYYLSNRF